MIKFLVIVIMFALISCDEAARTCYRLCAKVTNACVSSKNARKENRHECYVLNTKCVRECSPGWKKK